jgi:hypothetical protein
LRIYVEGCDARADDAQATHVAVAKLGIEERKRGSRWGSHFRARTTSTMGRPSHRR